MSADLKLVSAALSKPPFNKRWSIIQLHDELGGEELLTTVFEIALYVDEANKPSVFGVDREFEEKVYRLSEFLRMLKFEHAIGSVETCISKLLALDREFLLDVMSFLVADLNTHRKRAYLAQYLSIPAVPEEFAHDEGIVNLTREIENMQEEFKNTHKYLDSMKQSGPNSGAVKREIQQMEEEKQQLNAKIVKIQKRVQNIPKADQWLQAGKNLRTEQLKEMSLEDTLKEQTTQMSVVEKKYTAAAANLKSVLDNLSSLNADAVFAKVEEGYRMNKFLATVNLPKAITEAKSKVADLKDILSREEISDVDIGRIEKEINETNQINSRLIEEKMKSTNTGDANLSLFRQQASIISSKKEGTLAQLNAINEEYAKLQKIWNEKQEQQGGTSKKILVGDDFKRYVSELRGKSTLFKRKKTEMSSITTEFGILQRTQEILIKKVGDLQGALSVAEKKQGIAGYHQAQENLEKVSEMKSEKDEEKGKKLQEISELVQELVQSINEKKSLLAPIIQNLRTMRQEHQELQDTLEERKKIYDSTMYGVESQLAQINTDVKATFADIHAKERKYHLLNLLIQDAEIAQDRIMNEMKAYIGADEMIEVVQKSRGFKSYRDLYTKKIGEGENASRILKIQQKEVKMKHEPNMRQISMFSSVQQLLALKLEHNKKVISGRGLEDDVGVSLVTQDRLVLS